MMTKNKARIVVEKFPNSQCREYHLTMSISEYPLNSFDRPLRDSSKEYLEKIGPKGAELVKKVLEIPGIVSVYIRPYSMSPHIGIAFKWDDIEPRVIEVLKDSFGDEKNSVAVSFK